MVGNRKEGVQLAAGWLIGRHVVKADGGYLYFTAMHFSQVQTHTPCRIVCLSAQFFHPCVGFNV
jgi:hypothetical protein